MSRYAIGINDFRVIQKASVKPEGITLIAGGNGEGKSTLIKALRAMLSNDAAGNERHGTNGFGVAVQIGENKLLYMRSKDKTSVKFNDEDERTKLGQNPLYKIEPRFPLKRYDFVDSRFFPNFAMQNSVPVFNEIDIQELFSVMFGSVAKVSDRVTHCRNSCVNTSKERDTAESNSKLFKAKIAEQSKAHDALLAQVPNLETTYGELKGLAERKARANAFQEEYARAQADAPDEDLRALMPYVAGAMELFPALTLVESVEGMLGLLGRLKEQLAEVEVQLKAVPEIPRGLLELVLDRVRKSTELDRAESALASLPHISLELLQGVRALVSGGSRVAKFEGELARIPQVDPRLVRLVGELQGVNTSLDALSIELAVVSKAEEQIQAELAKAPCLRFASGHCPTVTVGTIKA